MTPDRHRQISELVHAALTIAPEKRPAFLDEACKGDKALRRELEALLTDESSATGFFSTPARVGGLNSAVSLIGRQVGSYTIQAQLGAGAMGEVYRARDSKLGRDVAIKILPRFFTTDPERRARFDREARLLASLNHPHIGAIYGREDIEGTPALILELVDGDTLAERIARGPIPIGEALRIARQMAAALAAAHEKGITHRDLKPANIKITSDGVVKVLDFGLAKVAVSDTTGRDPAQSPTITVSDGIILGTAGYMSPEQARGKAVDRQTDIWAFGCVLYEMLTGHVAFAGDTISDTIAAILGREPEWAALPTPATLRLLHWCLEKDPRRRLHDIADARLELDGAESGRTDDRQPASHASRRERLLLIAALALVSAIAVVSLVRLMGRAGPARELRLDIATPPTENLVSMALSPDGEAIVFTATSQGRSQLWLRSLGSGSGQPLTATDGATYPFWSPDSRSVGFFAEEKLKRIDLDSGSVQVLADNVENGRGGTWNRDGIILFNILFGGPLFRVSATTGQVAAATQLQSPKQSGHRFPQFLPDGRHFLYYAAGAPESRGVHVGQLDGPETRRLFDADGGAVYASSGHLLFVRQGALFAQKFDATGLRLTGPPVLIENHVANLAAVPALSVSSGGRIAYRAGSGLAPRRLVWVNRSGKEVGWVGDVDSGNPLFLSITRDEKRLAMQRSVDENRDIWLLETARKGLRRLTSDQSVEYSPLWSPDGDRIVYSSNRMGHYDLYLRSLTNAGIEERLLATSENNAATDWSEDGKLIIYTRSQAKTGYDIWALPLEGDGRKPFQVVQTDFDEQFAQLSPNMKWIAYSSNESKRFEIYIQPFRGSGAKIPISANGGSNVRWRRDGTELFYIAPDGHLMAAPIGRSSNGHGVDIGTPVPLFETHIVGGDQYDYRYDVSSDAQRFLLNKVIEVPAAPITVILNWNAGR